MLAQATDKTSHYDTRTPTVISASQDLSIKTKIDKLRSYSKKTHL